MIEIILKFKYVQWKLLLYLFIYQISNCLVYLLHKNYISCNIFLIKDHCMVSYYYLSFVLKIDLHSCILFWLFFICITRLHLLLVSLFMFIIDSTRGYKWIVWRKWKIDKKKKIYRLYIRLRIWTCRIKFQKRQ